MSSDHQTTDATPAEEAACRAYCAVRGIDPDRPSYGLGSIMPEGWQGPCWQVQLPAIRAALAAAREPGHG